MRRPTAVPFLLLSLPIFATPQPAALVEQGVISFGYSSRAANYQALALNTSSSGNVDLFNTRLTAPVAFNFIDGIRPWIGTEFSLPTSGASLSSVPRPDTLTPLRYRSSDSDFSANLWLGKSLANERLSVGIGHRFLFAAAATAEAQVGENPVGRMELSTGPRGAWFLGVASLLEGHEMSAYYSQSLESRLTQHVNASVQVTPAAIATIPMTLSATSRWEPESATLAYRYHLGRDQSFGASATWENWRSYQPPFMTIEASGVSQPDNHPEMRNVVSPGLNWHGRLLKHHLYFDYSFHPTPLTDTATTGVINLLDADTHSFLLRYSYELGNRSSISLFNQYDRFNERQVIKSDPTGLAGPGYTIRGYAWTWGLSLNLAI
ncbi:MAG: hypothetical protein HYR96_12445 [Deltaproteobacteria bacterium]|nr:hypothetical protein [Deltaproteobacteria bacterium]MBI3296143.1 hypothetical protein [Deltaproteobacteria bacterium]